MDVSQRRPKSSLLLFAASSLGFVIFAILHNLLYAIGQSTDLAWLRAVTEGLHVGAFLIALLLCPADVAVGLLGWITTVVRIRRHRISQRPNGCSRGRAAGPVQRSHDDHQSRVTATPRTSPISSPRASRPP